MKEPRTRVGTHAHAQGHRARRRRRDTRESTRRDVEPGRPRRDTRESTGMRRVACAGSQGLGNPVEKHARACRGTREPGDTRESTRMQRRQTCAGTRGLEPVEKPARARAGMQGRGDAVEKPGRVGNGAGGLGLRGRVWPQECKDT